MKNKAILIVAGDPNSVFFEIFFKSLKLNKFKSPIILIASKKLLELQLKRFNYNIKIKLLDFQKVNFNNLDNKSINLVNVNLKKDKKIRKNLDYEIDYIKQSFKIAFKILKKGICYKLINGPINKTGFLNKKFLGITEYISKAFGRKKNAMLIYNKELSVCPLTTHLPLKLVSKKISQNLIKEKTILINNFFKKELGFKPKIAVTGLNPHCESILKLNEDNTIIAPAVNSLKKKGYNISGPFSADTIFMKQNRKKYNIILGMYHDQVLTPIKTLKEYDAINITLGLPFYRVSPDHGPNIKMKNKNISNPLSLIKAIQFLDNK